MTGTMIGMIGMVEGEGVMSKLTISTSPVSIWRIPMNEAGKQLDGSRGDATSYADLCACLDVWDENDDKTDTTSWPLSATFFVGCPPFLILDTVKNQF